MKKVSILCFGLCAVLAFSSCRSSESAYRKAYEKAKLQETAQSTATSTTVQNTPTVTPTTAVPTNDSSVNGTVGDVSVKSEDVNLINGEGIKAFSVVVGSFTLQANAEGLQAQLKQAGYSAQIVQNPVTKMFRVVASTFADKNDAVSSRNTLRASYPQAWLLYKK